jgi:methylated-DNA-[protein]-cysteine S-methyltransferase
MSTIVCTTATSPLGPLHVAASGEGLIGAWFDGQRHFAGPSPQWQRAPDHRLLREAQRQIAAYFDGALRQFDLPLDLRGTPFQRAVWRAIAAVPYGVTISYAALAASAGAVLAFRACGAATGRNPLSIVVPCHRIVGSGGALTGYAGGLARKRALLALESGSS